MARFSGIPALPEGNIDDWQAAIIGALKQNVELLTGTRGEVDEASRAILRGEITVASVPSPQFTQLSARGIAVKISNVSVPVIADYVNLIQDVQALSTDVAQLRTTLSALLDQLRSQ